MSKATLADAPGLAIHCRSSRWWGRIREARWVETSAQVFFAPRLEDLSGRPVAVHGEFVILELPAKGPETVLPFVQHLAVSRRRRAVVCLAQPEQFWCEYAFREAGASDVLLSVAEFPRLRRAVQTLIESFVPAPFPWQRRPLEQLPWRTFS